MFLGKPTFMRSPPLAGGFGCATGWETNTLVSSKRTVLCLNGHHLIDRVMYFCVIDCKQKKKEAGKVAGTEIRK